MKEESVPKRKSWIYIVAILVVLIIVATVYFFVFPRIKIQMVDGLDPNPTFDHFTWQNQGTVISGKYADADVVDLGNGNFRMYYSVEPEVSGNNLEVFSAVSTDGVTWTKEAGVRKTMATFPDVLKLSDGTFRMYFQNAGVIKSAKSTDGLSWTDEPGVRVDNKEPGYNLESVGAETTILLTDGSFLMLYRGTIPEPYQTSEKIPNQTTQLYFWASSPDGLVFSKKGVAIDSRNDQFYGLTDGADWVKWDSSANPEVPEYRVFLWTYSGVYYFNYTETSQSFSQPFPAFAKSENKFAPNPPCDPTVAKINGRWMMFYGQHSQGIFRAEYKQ